MTKKRARVEVAAASGLAPFPAYFPSGFVPKDNDTFEVYQHLSKKNTYVIGAERDGVALVGHAHEGASGGACQYAVGVYNKRKGTLTICPADCDMTRVEVRVPGANYAAEEAPSSRATDDANKLEERREKTKALVAEFGSLRRRRQMTLKENAKVDDERIAGSAAVQSMLGRIGAEAEEKGETKDKILATAHMHRNIPPHEPTATRAWLAYPWDELCPEGAAHSLEVDRLLRAAASEEELAALQEEKRFNPYVRGRVLMLKGIANQDARRRAAQWLAFLHPLMECLRMPGAVPVPEGGIPAIAEKYKCPVGAMDACLALFFTRAADPKGRDTDSFVRSQDKKTLLLGYVVVAALAAEGYKMEPKQFDALRYALKMDARALSSHARELGCEVSSSTTKAKDGSPMYKLSLLPERTTSKMLQDCFPKPKLGRTSRR